MNVIIYSIDDTIVVFRREIYAEPHQHHALQITLAINGQFDAVVDGNEFTCRVLIIGSDQLHQVRGQTEWVMSLLINPESSFAKVVHTEILKGQSNRVLDLEFYTEVDEPLSCEQIQSIISDIRDELVGSYEAENSIDPRIVEATEMIRRLPEKKIPLQDLSRHVHLSESRFGHLFSEEIGIPLRRYLLWHRLLAALEIIGRGENFTFAAHEAGFTDSAHLGRTFNQMFGIKLSDMFANRDLIHVVRCDDSS